MSWKEQLKNSIKSIEFLKNNIDLSKEEIESIKEVTKKFKMRITPYYVSLMDNNDPNCPIRKIAIPDIEEINKKENYPNFKKEKKIEPVLGIKRRYPDRCLLIPTLMCPNYCRYCFRKFWVGRTEKTLSKPELKKAIDYIRADSRLREVILSGGDPLILTNKYLKFILSELKQINHIKLIRIGTRTPVFLPSRITDELIQILRKFSPIVIVTHFNHPKEITKQSKNACLKLVNNGIAIFNQTVLLKGINNSTYILKDLFLKLLEFKVKPYYLFHCINTMGNEHFVTKIDEGIKIIKELYCNISGLAIPMYVKATYYGKVMLMPNYIQKYEKNKLTLQNFKGIKFTIKEDV